MSKYFLGDGSFEPVLSSYINVFGRKQGRECYKSDLKTYCFEKGYDYEEYLAVIQA